MMVVRLSFGLGILSLVAIAMSHLASTDIWHGRGGTAEWHALQVSCLIILAFHMSALLTLWRILRVSQS